MTKISPALFRLVPVPVLPLDHPAYKFANDVMVMVGRDVGAWAAQDGTRPNLRIVSCTIQPSTSISAEAPDQLRISVEIVGVYPEKART